MTATRHIVNHNFLQSIYILPQSNDKSPFTQGRVNLVKMEIPLIDAKAPFVYPDRTFSHTHEKYPKVKGLHTFSRG